MWPDRYGKSFLPHVSYMHAYMSPFNRMKNGSGNRECKQHHATWNALGPLPLRCNYSQADIVAAAYNNGVKQSGTSLGNSGRGCKAKFSDKRVWSWRDFSR